MVYLFLWGWMWGCVTHSLKHEHGYLKIKHLIIYIGFREIVSMLSQTWFLLVLFLSGCLSLFCFVGWVPSSIRVHIHLFICSLFMWVGCCCHGDVILWWHQHELAFWLLSPSLVVRVYLADQLGSSLVCLQWAFSVEYWPVSILYMSGHMMGSVRPDWGVK